MLCRCTTLQSCMHAVCKNTHPPTNSGSGPVCGNSANELFGLPQIMNIPRVSILIRILFSRKIGWTKQITHILDCYWSNQSSQWLFWQQLSILFIIICNNHHHHYYLAIIIIICIITSIHLLVRECLGLYSVHTSLTALQWRSRHDAGSLHIRCKLMECWTSTIYRRLCIVHFPNL